MNTDSDAVWSADRLSHVLSRWGMENAQVQPHAKRENVVYRIEHQDRTFALRQHRAGYRTDVELISELDWMDAVGHDVNVPKPIPTPAGTHLEVIDGVQFDILEWLPGEMLVQSMQADPADRCTLMRLVGQMAARLHLASDNWTPPDTFARCDWGLSGLVGDSPVWGRFWDVDWISDADRTLFAGFRNTARTTLETANLDHGLIHADLLGENVLVDGTNISLIDFDDGGFGYRLYELSTALIRQIDAPDYEDLKAALFEGYRQVRDLDTDLFDLILALRATTYVGWIDSRNDLADAAERRVRNASIARTLIQKL